MVRSDFDKVVGHAAKELEKVIIENHKQSMPLLESFNKRKREEWAALPWHQKIIRKAKRKHDYWSWRLKLIWEVIRGKHRCDW